MKDEIPSPKQGKNTPKKTATPQKTPAKKSPVKKKSPKSNGKANATKSSSLLPFTKVKTESDSPVKVKVNEKEKMETDEANEDTSKLNTSDQKEEKPKSHPFFSGKKQSAEDTSNAALYDPSKANYHPIKDCFWKHGEK